MNLFRKSFGKKENEEIKKLIENKKRKNGY